MLLCVLFYGKVYITSSNYHSINNVFFILPKIVNVPLNHENIINKIKIIKKIKKGVEILKRKIVSVKIYIYFKFIGLFLSC
jgi:hypothetical protein